MKAARPFSDRFVARARVAKDAAHVSVSKGTVVYLGYDVSGGGWYQWRLELQHAYPFASQVECRQAAMSCRGPHYYAPDQSTIEILAAEYTAPADAHIRLKGMP